MKIARMGILISVLVLCAAAASFAVVTDDPTESGGDARLLGMGQAYSAVSNDTNAIFLNPAGLGAAKSMELSGMYYQRMFGSYYYLSGAGAIPTEYGTFGLGYVGSGTGRIVDTTDPNDPGEFGYSDNVLLLSYGSSMGRFNRDLRRLFVGSNLKLFSRGYDGSVGDHGGGLNLDLGLKYYQTTWLYFGLTKTNVLPKGLGGGILWTSGHNEDLESITRLGAAVKLFDGAQVVGLDMKVPSSVYRPILWALGTEYRMNEYLAFRAGLSENIDAQASSKLSWDPSLGIGFNYQNLSIDYAYRPYFSDSTNASHYVSLSFSGNFSDVMKIWLGKLDDSKFKNMTLSDIPGKVYDDLGNVVAGAQSRYHSGVYWNPHLSALNSLVPVTAQVIDYDTLFAMAFSDIKAAKEEQSPRKYWPGDVVPIIVEAPYDIDNIVSVMPNGDQIKLVYDDKASAWYGIWRVPKGMASGLYRAKMVATDFEGVKVTSDSTPFFIESSAAGAGKPGTGVAAPPLPETKTEAPVVKAVETPQAEAPKTVEIQKPVEVAKPAEVTKPVEPVKTAETQKPAETPKPVEPAKPIEAAPVPAEGLGGPVRTEPAIVSLNAPEDETIVHDDSIVVSGSVGKSIKKLTLNGERVSPSGSGSFAVSVPLSLGKNLITLKGETPDGGSAVVYRKVLRLSQGGGDPGEEAILTIASDSLNRQVNMSDTLTRAEAAVIISEIDNLTDITPAQNPFKDVNIYHWAAKKIEACKEARVVGGYPDGTFVPKRRISLIEFASLVLRVEKIPHPRPAGLGPFWGTGVMAKVSELKLLGPAEKAISDFKKAAIFSEAVEMMLKMKFGSEKAQDLLDWNKGY